MKTFFGVFSTDQMNKYGHKITVSALEDGVWQQGVYGMPMHLGHDLHRPTGWSIPLGLYFEPGITSVVGRTLVAEDKSDSEKIVNAQRNHLVKSFEDSISPYKEAFINLLGKHYTDDGFLHYASCASYVKKNVLYDVFDKLNKLAKNEKNGLIYLDDLLKEFEYLSQGIFKHKKSNFVIFAHEFFRRSLSRLNNYHFIFLDELMQLKSDKKVRVRIALDTDMVGYAPSVLTSFEYEFWYGGKYTDDISSIKPGPAAHRAEDYERIYYGIDRTEFFWKHNENKYEFELEEVRNEPTPGLEQDYGCRYVHSIYDKKLETFEHFDGAIRNYNPDLMLERFGMKMSEFGRRSQYLKIFRIDGKLPLHKWKSLVTNYLQSNPLIYEYFGLEKPVVRRIIENPSSSIKDLLVPFSINKNEGIRMLVSYHETLKNIEHERFISIFDAFSIGDETQDAIEYDVIELKKSLNRVGGDLHIPKNILNFHAEDMYCNIPCVFHKDEKQQELVNQTILALKNIFGALVKKESAKVFSFTLAWNMGAQQARISILGHVFDLYNWICSFKEIPVEHAAFKEWLEKQSAYLSKITTSEKRPSIAEVVQYDGILYIKRRPVQSDVNINYETAPDGIRFQIEFNENQGEIMNAIKNKEIHLISAYISEEIICNKDDLNYLDSPYSTFLDEDISQKVKRAYPIGMFWSDKPA